MKKEMILATAQQFTVQDQALVFETSVGELLDQSQFIIAQRQLLDCDPAWSHYRQLIPYVLVVDENKRILTYTRTAKGGENRLHNCVSIGWGGHIDLDDIYTDDSIINLELTLRECAIRELSEELGLHSHRINENINDKPNAFIISDKDAVSHVHLGVVRTVRVSSEIYLNIEDSAKLLGWKTFEELREMSADGQLEAWTQALVTEPDSIDQLLSVAHML